jgi:hypothetical protein
MEQADAKARLQALHKTVGRALEQPGARYFDPQVVVELFERWSPVRDTIRSQFGSILGDLPSRPTPTPSQTTDFDGRGYIERQYVQQLHDDMQYALDALAAVPVGVAGAPSKVVGSRKTGRTLWDFLSSLLENRTVLHWTSAVAWLLIVGFVVALYSGHLSIGVAGMGKSSAGTKSPFVHWVVLPTEAASSNCDLTALGALQTANPVKLEEADVEDDMRTRVADFGSLTAFISCIDPHENTLIYIGVAGDDFSEGKNKAAQLRALVASRLP